MCHVALLQHCVFLLFVAHMHMQNILKREVAKFEQLRILTGTALGELDHPNYASQYFKCLNLPNVSHQV